VRAEAVRVLRWFAGDCGLDLALVERDFGSVNWHKHGTLIPDESWAQAGAADAIQLARAPTRRGRSPIRCRAGTASPGRMTESKQPRAKPGRFSLEVVTSFAPAEAPAPA